MAREIFENFNEDIQTYGIGSIGELYDADPPFAPRGAFSQAWSVAAVLDILHQIRLHEPATEGKKPAKKTAAAKKPAAAKAAAAPKKAAKEASRSEEKAPKAPARRAAAKKTAAKAK